MDQDQADDLDGLIFFKSTGHCASGLLCNNLELLFRAVLHCDELNFVLLHHFHQDLHEIYKLSKFITVDKEIG